MKSSIIKVSVILDTRRQLKNRKYPLKLSVSVERNKKWYNTGYQLFLDEWELLNQPNLKDHYLKSVRQKLNSLVLEAEGMANKLKPFSFIEFEKSFLTTDTTKSSLSLESLFNNYIEMLENENRIGTAESYKGTLNSLLSFRSQLDINEITRDFLHEYEKFMLAKGSSPSTIGIYLRQLRRIVNVAITNGLYRAEKYPFRGYVIPSSRNIKKALSISQIKALFEYSTTDESTRRGLDFWLFSYMSNGMNMADICYLKPQNLQGDFFFYYRVKTKNTKKKDLRPIKVPLLPKSIQIIENWKSLDQTNPYLFPILDAGLTAKQEKFRIKAFIKKINKIMKGIAADLKIPNNIGTYVARHSYSTILKRSGAPVELIQENLGHSSVLTTQSYLDDFTDDFKMDYANVLVKF